MRAYALGKREQKLYFINACAFIRGRQQRNNYSLLSSMYLTLSLDKKKAGIYQSDRKILRFEFIVSSLEFDTGQ